MEWKTIFLICSDFDLQYFFFDIVAEENSIGWGPPVLYFGQSYWVGLRLASLIGARLF